MPEDIKQYRIFVGSPSGLKKERTKIREEVVFYSTIDCEPGKISFKPFFWEELPPTFRNPQEIIDAHLRECDFYILILHSRWGTPPRGNSQYSSGSEHEFELACKCCENKTMRDVAVFFKEMSKSDCRTKDGKKVIKFRKKLEGNKKLFFKPFKDIREFHSCIRQCLAKWRCELTSQAPTPPANVRDFFKD